ncbi:MAG: hypothetical protein ACJZ4X_06960 [Candidatus Thalassarchaeaceae archaeon]
MGLGGALPSDDLEYNYTITWSTYSQSASWTNPSDDAGTGSDAGDDYTSRATIPTRNNTYTASAHDVWDEVDQYEIYIPENYAMRVTLDYPRENYMSMTLGTNASLDSMATFTDAEYPQAANTMFSDGDNTVVISVEMLRGSGDYSMLVEMLWPENTLNPDERLRYRRGLLAHPMGLTSAAVRLWRHGAPELAQPHGHGHAQRATDIGPTGGTCTAWVDYSMGRPRRRQGLHTRRITS